MGLLATTAATLLAIGKSDPPASLFHLAILCLLRLPLLPRRQTSQGSA
jgi:hypothetical protein